MNNIVRLNTLRHKGLVAEAEYLGEHLARTSAVLERVAWEIDSALSGLRKDDAGYRVANAANPDGGSNSDLDELADAVQRALDLLKVGVLPSPRDLRHAESLIADAVEQSA